VDISGRECWQRGGVASGLNTGAVRKPAMALNHAINVRGNGITLAQYLFRRHPGHEKYNA
jgi:hypothetical protein